MVVRTIKRATTLHVVVDVEGERRGVDELMEVAVSSVGVEVGVAVCGGGVDWVAGREVAEVFQ
ncbi:hypothetical protein [Nonomuraea sp. NPDC046570]|uniref:hypothetical protein n=1 Tax=Nonomuraea sp. NPDC046570 TaxID=3155255 RepID=UPI00340AABE5